MTAPRVPYSETVLLESLIPAPGWQAVYFDDTGAHFLSPLYILALATLGDEQAVVGLDYDPVHGFDVCDEDNFCGLRPPDWTLREYEQAKCCAHSPKEV
jgi:hypothetical protein